MKQFGTIVICMLGAAFFVAVQKELIIFKGPQATYSEPNKINTTSCTLYWYEDMLEPETKLIVQTNDPQENMLYLINSWLQFLYSEDVYKKVHAETVMISPSGHELFVSFDQRPFEKQMSVAEKLGFIRNLFKTIRPHTAARKVRLLVRHAPLIDAHLDFNSGWDIEL